MDPIIKAQVNVMNRENDNCRRTMIFGTSQKLFSARPVYFYGTFGTKTEIKILLCHIFSSLIDRTVSMAERIA